MEATRLPVSVVIPTRHRAGPLRRTLESLAKQSAQPAEVVVVDASDDDSTRRLCNEHLSGQTWQTRWFAGAVRGAAPQRNEGVARAACETIAFFDDDILFEPDCMARLWSALQSDEWLGGVNATITNQSYTPPRRISRAVLSMLAGKLESSYAGRVVGPGVNLLPDDRSDLAAVVRVEWLNTTCTCYRRAALPTPVFPTHFTGYSLCEDLTLSLMVGKSWRLANARTARIFHDSQPGDHKRCAVRLAAMEIVNRHFVMTEVLAQNGVLDYFRLGVWEAFQIAAGAQGGIGRLCAEAAGKVLGVGQLVLRELS